MIYIYECVDAPVERRFIAQFERLKNNLYMTIHGASAYQARAKAELMLQYAALEPVDRTGFKLRERLAAIPVQAGEPEEIGHPDPEPITPPEPPAPEVKKLRRGADLI